MESSKKERILRMLDGERTGEIFCTSNVTSVTSELMQEMNVFWPDAHLDPELMAKLSEGQYTIFGFDSVRSCFDVGVEAEAFGSNINYGNKERNLYVTEPAFENLDLFDIPPNIFELGRFPIHFNALSILYNKYHQQVPIYALILGPLTLMGHLYGVDKIMRLSLKDRNLFFKLLENVTNFVVLYGNKLLETGADALAMGDPTASANLISPKVFKEFMLPVYKKLSSEIKGRVILHICGDTTLFLKDIKETGFCAFSFEGPAVKVEAAKEVLGNTMALFGNIPTVSVLMNGTPSDVEKSVYEAISGGINSVVAACSLPLQTPTTNIKTMVKNVEEANKNNNIK